MASRRRPLGLGAIRSLGTVESQTVHGQDVTSQYVDLGARLKIAEQRVAVLARLMSKASGLNETLQIQREIDSTQLVIEQIKGQLRVLHDQTSLSSITLLMREQGAPVASTSSVHTPSLWLGLRHAIAGFFAVLVAIIVGLGYLVPILALAGLVWLVVRRVRRRRDEVPVRSRA